MTDIVDRLDKASRFSGMALCAEAKAEIERLQGIIAASQTAPGEAHELVGFVAIWAVQYAKDHGLNGLLPTHYDLLKKYGARMDSFKRASALSSAERNDV